MLDVKKVNKNNFSYIFFVHFAINKKIGNGTSKGLSERHNVIQRNSFAMHSAGENLVRNNTFKWKKKVS